jgi:hypothetical protein
MTRLESLPAQATSAPALRTVDSSVLTIAYQERGDPRGFPVILLHGFPADVRAWDEVAPPLTKAGYRVLAPYLRGFGPTTFRDASAPRMAEEAAIGQDVIDFADALGLPRFALSGYARAGPVDHALRRRRRNRDPAARVATSRAGGVQFTRGTTRHQRSRALHAPRAPRRRPDP